MKKATNKFIAILLSLTLVFTMSGVAFAGTDMTTADVSAAKASAFEKDTMKQPQVFKKAGKSKMMEDAIDQLTVTTMTTSAVAEPDFEVWDLAPNSYAIAEVTAAATGWIWFDYMAEGVGASDYTAVYLYKASDMENPIQTASGYVNNGDELYEAGGVYAVKGDKFYLYMEAPTTNTDLLSVGVSALLYSSANNRMLYSYADASKYTLASGINKAGTGTSDLYFKIKPSKTGLLTVNLNSYSDAATVGTVTLYNANKVKLSNAVQYNSSKIATKAYFGVTKGKTYYIRVQNCGDAKGYYYTNYGIKYNVTSAVDRNIATNAKALSLKKGGAGYKTLFTANNATGTDVYKIYVPKKQTAKFTINTQKIRSGNLTIKVFKNGKQVGKTGTIYPKATSTQYTITYGTTYGKATKGTYHIKVTKGAKASGQYQIKYDK